MQMFVSILPSLLVLFLPYAFFDTVRRRTSLENKRHLGKEHSGMRCSPAQCPGG